MHLSYDQQHHHDDLHQLYLYRLVAILMLIRGVHPHFAICPTQYRLTWLTSKESLPKMSGFNPFLVFLLNSNP